jgi:xanthine dehydrogenase accessory factor
MSDWLTTLRALGDTPAVLISVARVKGSAPREAGTKLIVTADRVFGTIGGGNLEFQAIALARELLGGDRPRLESYPLGAALGQCCGGHVTLLFEPLVPNRAEWLTGLDDASGVLVTDTTDGGKLWVTAGQTRGGPDGSLSDIVGLARDRLHAERAELIDLDGRTLLFDPIHPPDFHIALFGAGHVGRALVQVLSGLPCRIHWIDSREQEFPDHLLPNVTCIVSNEPEMEVDDLPEGSYILVMTHSHPLDEAICERAMKRDRHCYLGLIGSRSKRARFEKRWRLHGVDEAAIRALTCPIGIDGISGKHPTEIAIAVAAQLLQIRERNAAMIPDG